MQKKMYNEQCVTGSLDLYEYPLQLEDFIVSFCVRGHNELTWQKNMKSDQNHTPSVDNSCCEVFGTCCHVSLMLSKNEQLQHHLEQNVKYCLESFVCEEEISSMVKFVSHMPT